MIQILIPILPSGPQKADVISINFVKSFMFPCVWELKTSATLYQFNLTERLMDK
jgi:hypothetical protein